MGKGFVIWFTGFPNAGKTTISKLVARYIEQSGHAVEILDSDELPRSLTKDLSPDWETRQVQKCTNLIYIAKLLYKYDVIVLISSVGRLQKMRDVARNEIADFVEVYLKCPLDVRLDRDTREKYRRHPATIHYYEEPAAAELTIETNKCSSEEAAVNVVDHLITHGYLGVYAPRK
ncbi:adenylyl-sulfate kinase [Numidum massiliense]|uniref:adenylyl-sulfate kinase n=1 Tax=Numidum massiliense TaxID=1522315 RepID=UPI0006D570AC|nr:adenylyl-sulfate kinase [Numidum massiliense]